MRSINNDSICEGVFCAVHQGELFWCGILVGVLGNCSDRWDKSHFSPVNNHGTFEKASQVRNKQMFIESLFYKRARGWIPGAGASANELEVCIYQVWCIYSQHWNKIAASRCASGSDAALTSFWWWKSSYTLNSNESVPWYAYGRGHYSGLCTKTVFL